MRAAYTLTVYICCFHAASHHAWPSDLQPPRSFLVVTGPSCCCCCCICYHSSTQTVR